MFEIPQKTFAAPPPLPIPSSGPPCLAAQDSHRDEPGLPPSLPPAGVPATRTDKVAIASTVCGLTPFIPVFSQVMGLSLGLWALVRIRRARRAGQRVNGRGWAAAGITGNGFVLLGLLALFASFAALKGSLAQATHQLHPLMAKPPIAHMRVRK